MLEESFARQTLQVEKEARGLFEGFMQDRNVPRANLQGPGSTAEQFPRPAAHLQGRPSGEDLPAFRYAFEVTADGRVGELKPSSTVGQSQAR